jgi:glycogen debranching enzyme
MDARVGDQVVTARTGKPVEVQALWLNALHIASRWDAAWKEAFDRGRKSFLDRFWNDEMGCLYDVVDLEHQPGAHDDAIRPNQIFAVGGLPIALLEGPQARSVVDLVENELWTPVGLRTLGPHEPGYHGFYEGGPAARDSAYHQGTAWPFLLGAFVDAWVRVRDSTESAKREARARFVEPLRAQLATAGLGHISEIFDGDPPHAPRGCPFQAWSLGELIRLEREIVGKTPAAAPAARSKPTTSARRSKPVTSARRPRLKSSERGE